MTTLASSTNNSTPSPTSSTNSSSSFESNPDTNKMSPIISLPPTATTSSTSTSCTPHVTENGSPTMPAVIKPIVHLPGILPSITSTHDGTSVGLSPHPSQGSSSQGNNSTLDQLRLHHLYILALADRMRALQSSSLITSGTNGQSSSLTQIQHRLPTNPAEFPPPHTIYPYGKFDPRMLRFPEEPKPQQSYIGLISMAILHSSAKKLVLADIYQYILDNFPYFRHRGPGWRNSIRHNLSLNDCFIKDGRAANGKGHYWAIHPACIEDFERGDYRRRKAQRKVRKHMGLSVDEDDSPSPPPPPPTGISPPMFAHHGGPGWPSLIPFPPQIHLQQHNLAAALAAAGPAVAAAAIGNNPFAPSTRPLMPSKPNDVPPVSSPINSIPNSFSGISTSQISSRKRQFDVASLLGQVSSKSESKIKKSDNLGKEEKGSTLIFPTLISPSASGSDDEHNNEEKSNEEETKTVFDYPYTI